MSDTSLRQRFTEQLKAAMIGKDQKAVGTIRLIQAAVKDADIDARGKGNPDGIAEAEVLALLQKMIKQRRESITQFEAGGRADLAEGEASEIAVIERFLPQALSAEETEAAIQGAIAELGATQVKDMGRVMAALKERYAGQIDFGAVGVLVKARLGG